MLALRRGARFAIFTGSGAPDIAPTVVSIEVGAVDAYTFVLLISEAVTKTTGNYHDGFSVSGNTIASSTRPDTTHIRLVVNTAIAYGDTPTVSYNSATGHIVDVDAGTALASFTAMAVTNNVAAYPFITRVGNKLYNGATEIKLVGTSMFWLGTDFSAGGWAPPPTGTIIQPSSWRVDDGFATAVMLGMNCIRTYGLGLSCGYTGTLYPTLGGSFSETVFAAMDYAIARAKDFGLRLIIPLTGDNYGMYNGDLGVFNFWGAGSHGAFFTSATAKANFKTYIAGIINRVNTVNGLRYGDDPTIAAWETGNELDPTDAWTSEICAYIKSLAPHQLTVDGKWPGSYGGISSNSLTDPNIDIISEHFYPMDSTLLASDLATISGAKPYMAGEYDWNRRNNDGDTLPTFIAALETNKSAIGIDTWWNLCGHADTYGFQSSYNSHAFDPGDANTDDAYGHPTHAANTVLLRNHAFAMRSLSVPSYPALTSAPVLATSDGSALTWRGVANALTYQMERSVTSSSTGFSIVATGLTDLSSPWTDPASPVTGGNAWYQVSGVNADSAVGPVSNVIELTYPTVYIYDTMTGADDTAIHDHAIAPINTPATAWYSLVGTQKISSNQAIPDSYNASSESVVWCDGGMADGVKKVTLKYSLLKDIARAYFRMVDIDNLWMVQLYAGLVYLTNRTSGVETDGATPQTLAMVDGTQYVVAVTLSGTSISVTVGGVTLACTSSARQTASKHGFGFYNLNGAGDHASADNYIEQ
jgi:hypothetical protein